MSESKRIMKARRYTIRGGTQLIPKAILLDMDDTIIAFEHGVDVDSCWKKACAQHLHAYDDARMDEIIMAIKQQAKWHWSDQERHRAGRLDLQKAREQIIAMALAPYGLQDPAVPRNVALAYGVERNALITVFPGAMEAIHYVKSRDIKVALITNGASAGQREKIERFRLSPLFDHIIIEEEFGAGKPDPSVYQHAVEQLGATREETWMVGDNYDWEVVAPQKLGIKGVWINHKGIDPRTMHRVQPYKSISTISELMDLLS